MPRSVLIVRTLVLHLLVSPQTTYGCYGHLDADDQFCYRQLGSQLCSSQPSLAAESCRSRAESVHLLKPHLQWRIELKEFQLFDSRRLRKKPKDSQDDVTDMFDLFDAHFWVEKVVEFGLQGGSPTRRCCLRGLEDFALPSEFQGCFVSRTFRWLLRECAERYQSCRDVSSSNHVGRMVLCPSSPGCSGFFNVSRWIL